MDEPVRGSPGSLWGSIAKVALVGILGLLLSCAGLFLFGTYPINGIRVEQLEADLNQRLPGGSSRAEAEAWFKSHGIPFHGIGEVGSERITGLGAEIPNNSLLESAVIRIYFSMPRDDSTIARFTGSSTRCDPASTAALVGVHGSAVYFTPSKSAIVHQQVQGAIDRGAAGENAGPGQHGQKLLPFETRAASENKARDLTLKPGQSAFTLHVHLSLK